MLELKAGMDIKGDPEKNCEDGDYLQFYVGLHKSKKICGQQGKSPLPVYVIGPFNEDVSVLGVFHSNASIQGKGIFIEIVPIEDAYDSPFYNAYFTNDTKITKQLPMEPLDGQILPTTTNTTTGQSITKYEDLEDMVSRYSWSP